MMGRVRPWLLRLHRTVGLSLAGVLICAGLTGSIAAFHDALDALLNPDLFTARNAGAPLPLPQLADRLSHQLPNAQLRYILYRPARGGTVRVFLQPRMGTQDDEVFLDPPTGAIQGMRPSAGCCFGRRVLIPFLYRFHYTLGLGMVGQWIMGIAAMAWAVDCVVGLLLTVPLHGTVSRVASWRRWGRYWRLSTLRPGFRLTFDLHRTVSLWLWVILLGVAVSGVSLALNSQVFRPVVGFLLPMTGPPAPPASDRAPSGLIGLEQAEEVAVVAAAHEGWRGKPGAMFISPETSVASFYFFNSTADEGTGFGSPVVMLDGHSGRVLSAGMPGRGKAGDLVLQLQFPWHSGQIAGLAGRIVIAVSGVAVSLLSATGVLIWERKRRVRRISDARRANAVVA